CFPIGVSPSPRGTSRATRRRSRRCCAFAASPRSPLSMASRSAISMRRRSKRCWARN
ncbi:MAG: hypothetical protein AVDCRST_MAG18-843, partial [uncultured Thermomicrobiales bacterium]